MVRRLIVLAVFGLATIVMAGTAVAQDSPGPSVAPTVVERTPPTVGGVVVRPLPRTGSDIDVEVLAGLGLTAAGVALAVTARERRRRFAAAHS